MENSYFDGNFIQLIALRILKAIIIVVSLGLLTPWAICMEYRWEVRHTVINGKRLYFDGKATQLFGNWIKWWLLTIITFGIYGFWLPIAIKKWITKHTYFIS